VRDGPTYSYLKFVTHSSFQGLSNQLFSGPIQARKQTRSRPCRASRFLTQLVHFDGTLGDRGSNQTFNRTRCHDTMSLILAADAREMLVGLQH